jgi:hypothetical protein
MRYVVALLATCLFAGLLYAVHYATGAALTRKGAGPDTMVPVSYWFMIFLAVENLLFVGRFILIGVFMAVSLWVAARWGRQVPQSLP